MEAAMHADRFEADLNAAPPVNERGRVVDADAPDDERTFGMLGHLSVLGHLVISGFAIIVPIVMYQSKKKDAPFAADHLREAINFQISLIIYTVALAIFSVVTIGIGLILAAPLGVGVYILGLIGVIQASMAANRGEYYRYPMTIRFLH
ncbi:MAG: membrane protein [Phycisphaeraceae bacterium]|nr:MAG: membrane protein [Phycisphaeraceae bacterium]